MDRRGFLGFLTVAPVAIPATAKALPELTIYGAVDQPLVIMTSVTSNLPLRQFGDEVLKDYVLSKSKA